MSEMMPTPDFNKIIAIIEIAHANASKAVNTELIRMYWDVGEYLAVLCSASSFGEKIIDE